MIKNKRGVKRQPCLTPLSIWKEEEMCPLTLIKASVFPIVSLTILMKDIGKPILGMILNRNCQSTQSKALEKSSLRKIVSFLDFLAHARIL